MSVRKVVIDKGHKCSEQILNNLAQNIDQPIVIVTVAKNFGDGNVQRKRNFAETYL